MITKILRRQLCAISRKSYKFSSLKETTASLFNQQKSAESHNLIATFDPLKPVDTHDVKLRRDRTPNYEVTKLNSGITVMTESLAFPNVVDMGILLNVGSRDENLETSGSLFTIKSNYHNTILGINENKNNILKTFGSELEMEYDQDYSYFKTNCLAHHVNDIFSILVDSALKPILDEPANIALDKLREIRAYDMGGDLTENLTRTAYGLQGLGMPLSGIGSNFEKLSAATLQQFQRENVIPERVFICAAGIEDHEEFVKLVESRTSFIQAKSNIKTKETSVYKGGEYKNETGGDEITVAVAFKSVPWSDKDIFAFQVLNTLMGSSASFSTGGPGKGMHARTTKHLLNKLSYVDSANTISSHFLDSGLFGLMLSGPSGNANDLLKALINEIKGLAKPIPAIELQRAKNITKSNILMALERQKDRLEESIKNIRTFGRLTFNEYTENVDKVTSDQINTAVNAMLLYPPTFVAEGGGIARLPNYDKLQNMIRL